MHVVLDISRLLGLAWAGQPTGIDRVEFAHSRHWRGFPARDVTFVAQSPWGWYAALPDNLARGLLQEADRAVAPGKEGLLTRFRAMAAAALSLNFYGVGRRDLARRVAGRNDSVFLIVSHRALHHERATGALIALGARFVPLLHDVIPLSHPEYTRPQATKQHVAKIDMVARRAAGAMITTQAAADSLARYLERRQQPRPRMAITGLGLDLRSVPVRRSAPATRPYFVMLGTIEPRKNHLLALQIWRELAQQDPEGAPRLLIIGRRGWENEHVFRMLDRGQFHGLVEECGRLPDSEVARLVRGATAVLCPSFTEGFGLPLAEAIALGTPVIASDIPAAREVGGEVPEYLHPLDFLGWRRAILEMSDPRHPRREAQLARLAGWSAPSWNRHFSIVENFLSDLVRGPSMPSLPVESGRVVAI
ncbi:glycosyltransferase family 4 protein [Roseococcus sp. YIM B11640]|uniref:glycosyltransferase family 4 protein n=1 Tax=Roseococcus sp. YIM B11640 TaxID=3133973 RepID=UPI003C797886